MNDGFIKIHRSLLSWEWYKDPNTKIVFLHLLLNANWEDNRFMGYEIPRGSLATSYGSLSKQLGISVKSVRTAINHLKRTGEVAVKRANKFSVINIVNWEKYQGYESMGGKVNGNQNGNQVAEIGQGMGNNKEYKEYKNIRNEEEYRQIFEFYNQLSNLIPCKTLNKPRLDKIKTLMNLFDTEEIKEVLQKANDTPWLTGQNGRKWKADFDWLLDEENFCKVQDGRYDGMQLVEKPKETNPYLAIIQKDEAEKKRRQEQLREEEAKANEEYFKRLGLW